MGLPLPVLALALGAPMALWAGCARGGDGMDTGGGRIDAPALDTTGVDVGRSDAAGMDVASVDSGPFDGGRFDGGRVDARDTGTVDGGRDVPSGGGLDPRLAVPPATNEPCGAPGSLSECPGIAVCRFFSSTEGRCESCTACGNLFDSCSTGEDCDILFVCFMGSCTNFCTLGTSECGPPGDCIDIGHPSRGACRPR